MILWSYIRLCISRQDAAMLNKLDDDDDDATSAVRPGCAEDTASAAENIEKDQR